MKEFPHLGHLAFLDNLPLGVCGNLSPRQQKDQRIPKPEGVSFGQRGQIWKPPIFINKKIFWNAAMPIC